MSDAVAINYVEFAVRRLLPCKVRCKVRGDIYEEGMLIGFKAGLRVGLWEFSVRAFDLLKAVKNLRIGDQIVGQTAERVLDSQQRKETTFMLNAWVPTVLFYYDHDQNYINLHPYKRNIYIKNIVQLQLLENQWVDLNVVIPDFLRLRLLPNFSRTTIFKTSFSEWRTWIGQHSHHNDDDTITDYVQPAIKCRSRLINQGIEEYYSTKGITFMDSIETIKHGLAKDIKRKKGNLTIIKIPKAKKIRTDLKEQEQKEQQEQEELEKRKLFQKKQREQERRKKQREQRKKELQEQQKTFDRQSRLQQRQEKRAQMIEEEMIKKLIAMEKNGESIKGKKSINEEELTTQEEESTTQEEVKEEVKENGEQFIDPQLINDLHNDCQAIVNYDNDHQSPMSMESMYITQSLENYLRTTDQQFKPQVIDVIDIDDVDAIMLL